MGISKRDKAVLTETVLVIRRLLELAEHQVYCPLFSFPTMSEDDECTCNLVLLQERAGYLAEKLAAMSVGRDGKVEVLELKATVMATALSRIWDAMEEAATIIESKLPGDAHE